MMSTKLPISYYLMVENTSHCWTAVAQVVSCKPVTSEGWVQSLASPVGLLLDEVALGQGFLCILTNFIRGCEPVERQTAKCMSE